MAGINTTRDVGRAGDSLFILIFMEGASVSIFLGNYYRWSLNISDSLHNYAIFPLSYLE